MTLAVKRKFYTDVVSKKKKIIFFRSISSGNWSCVDSYLFDIQFREITPIFKLKLIKYILFLSLVYILGFMSAVVHIKRLWAIVVIICVLVRKYIFTELYLIILSIGKIYLLLCCIYKLYRGRQDK